MGDPTLFDEMTDPMDLAEKSSPEPWLQLRLSLNPDLPNADESILFDQSFCLQIS
jgi:hypothetical protein